MRAQLLKHTEEKDLPDEYKNIRAVVYRADTPKEILQEIAGVHQAEQHDVMESSLADAYGFMLKKMQEQKDKLGTEYLNDDEIFNTLRTFGLVRGTEASLKMAATKERSITSKEAAQLQKKQVTIIQRGIPR